MKNTSTSMKGVRPGRRALALLLLLFAMPAMAQLTPQFSQPADNGDPGEPWTGTFSFPSSTYTQFTFTVLRGAHIVPATNIFYTSSSTNLTVTLTPLPDAPGGRVLVDIFARNNPGNVSTNYLLDVVFLPVPTDAVALTLGFTSPAATATPGATFVGPIEFFPADPSVHFTVTQLSGASIVPLSNISFTNVASNVVNIVMEPVTNRSGLVEVEVTGDDTFTSNSVSFAVAFKTYPPAIATISPVTMNEDTVRNVTVQVSDMDTPITNVTLSVSMLPPDNTSLFYNPALFTGLYGPGELSISGTSSNRTLRIEPAPHMNGAAKIRVVAQDDDQNFTTNDFNLVVSPVADRSEIQGVQNAAIDDDAGVTNVFAGVTILDVDHEMPNVENLALTVTLDNDQNARFADGSISFGHTGTPAQVTQAIRNLGVAPLRFRGLPGAINTAVATIKVKSTIDNLITNRTANIEITVVNTPPDFNIVIDPGEMVEGSPVRQPFYLPFIFDPDFGDNQFTLSIGLVDPAQAHLLVIGTETNATDNFTGLAAWLRNVTAQAPLTGLTNAFMDVPIAFLLTDGYDGTTALTNTIRILQRQSPPQVSGIPVETVSKTDADSPFVAFPTVFVTDPDEGGNQLVRAVLTQSNPLLGTFQNVSEVTGYQTPASLTARLREVTFEIDQFYLPVGAIEDSVFTVEVFDVAGLSARNSNRRLRVTSVNSPPQIQFLPPFDIQPVLIPPVEPLRPFTHVAVSNDDTNNVRFTITIDDPAKGTLENLGGFGQIASGVYRYEGSIGAIQGDLTNLVYVLNPAYLFPPDAPGGTVFTLEARDYALLTTTRTLQIQVQDEPRNHLVTRLLNDGQPGSFSYALAHAGNNDVITFALPEYPATIRMPGVDATLLDRNITIKGPGADLLTISGDGTGDGIPNRQIFRVAAFVTIEGVTLSHGTAGFGGAVLVQSTGRLVLRDLAVVDSVAAQYGGAIDVDGGALVLEGCTIARNRLSQDTGQSGAGVSIYSDKDILIRNTTFGKNQQPNLTGDGGGALVAQNLTPATPMRVRLEHTTFVENSDAADVASAVLGISFGTRFYPQNSIFADISERNLQVLGSAEFRSQGGNIAIDSTRTLISQQGQSELIYLLDHSADRVSLNPRLGAFDANSEATPFYPLLAGSPAINTSSGSTAVRDQRGVLRDMVPDVGAAEFSAAGRLVINEIRFDDVAGVNYVEIVARRDSSPIDLSSYQLYVDNQPVHAFSGGSIVGTNSLFSVGDPAPTLLAPGNGMIVAFTSDPVTLTSDTNPTPVVGASLTNAPTSLPVRGSVAIGVGSPPRVVAEHHYLGTYLDPATGTNLLRVAGNSITLAPQFRGYALIPHGYAAIGPFAGADMTLDPSDNPSSPGADVSRTPFGQDNAEPFARDDVFTVGEDDLGVLAVLANDFDADGNDRLVIVDVSTTSPVGTTTNAVTTSQLGALVTVIPQGDPLRGASILYDPREAPQIQQLPAGVEIIDTFYYEIIDIGTAPIEAYAFEGPDVTRVTSTHHRLLDGEEITISGAAVAAYNGIFPVTVLDEDTFTIPMGFAGNTSPRGMWETVEPRSPTSRSQARVSVRVIGANDPPVAVLDTITNVTERSTVRIMTRPERAGDTSLVFAGDPSPAPTVLDHDLLSNDFDVDTDDTWGSLQVIGVMGVVHPIVNYTGSTGSQPVTVQAPRHGLGSGTEVLIANYGGHVTYNGRHTITVLDADHFSIPVFYVDNHPGKGVWVILNDANRLDTVTDVGARVTLALRADPTLDHVIYDANVSAFLRTLSEGQLYTNRFWYAIADRHGAVGIGPIDVIVEGINDQPVPLPDPDSLEKLVPLVSSTNTLADVLEAGLDLMYTLPPDSGAAGRTNLYVLDRSGTLPGTIVLGDFFVTDEDTSLDIETAELLANVTEIDMLDVVTVIDVDLLSREGAALTLAGGTITYDPTSASNLQALAREEMLIDTFEVTLSDGMTDGTVTSLVAVLVTGLNDSPIAHPISFALHHPEAYTTDEDAVWSVDLPTLMARGHAVEYDINGAPPDDRLRFIPVADVANPGLAAVTISPTQIVHNATVSDLLNELADWQSFTNTFPYAIRDNSFLFAVDDAFYVPAGTQGRVLDVLANDRDFTDAEGVLTIVDAGPTLHGGIVGIGVDGHHLVYSAPAGFVGDDYFRYIIENDQGDRNAGLVRVRCVVPALNGVLLAADNHFAVAAGETVVLGVTANDGVIPYAGQSIEITQLLQSNMAGQPVLTNNTFVFTAGTASPLIFDYEISAGGEARARARVRVDVLERRGTLRVQHDTFSVRPGTVDNELDVLANDALLTAPTRHLRIKDIVSPGVMYGTVAIHTNGTRLLYTPNPDFIGVEQFQYVATDQIGGTGTATVHVAVGRIEPLLNYFTLRAANPDPVLLEVLANNRIMPEAEPGTLTITNISPASAGIGSVSIVDGKQIAFTASGTLGQQEFSYTILDASTPPRTATGQVVIEAVGNGTYANPNVFSVRGGGSDYVFNVLTNDVSYPSEGRSYSILSLGTGANAPNQGGTVAILDNKLVYTPAPGFFGTERFTYVMSDTIGTDTAEVVVQVRRGNLTANADAYSLYYEMGEDSLPRSFEFPVTLNDRIQPALGQTFNIHAIGMGTNAPNMGGTVSIAPSGLSLIYRPGAVPTPEYVETFTYELIDSSGRFVEGRVRVTVRDRTDSLNAQTQDDYFNVARNSTNNLLPVLSNDFVLPGTAAGWSIRSVGSSVYGGTTAVAGQSVRYTPPAGFTGRDSFTYVASDGLGGTGSATVYVQVGSLPVLENLFTVLSDTAEEELDVLGNDLLFASYAGVYSLDSVFGASQGGTVALSTNQAVLYSPDPGYAGLYPYRETFHYRVPYDSGQTVTGTVHVIVHEAGSDRSANTITLLVEGLNDPPWIENDAPNPPITDKQTAAPFVNVSIFEVDEQHQEALEVTVSLDDADKGVLQNLGDFVSQGNGSYVLTNATAALATAQIRGLIFEPTENRITVPTTETTVFTISVTDLKSPPVTDTNAFIAVTAVNDPPIISGTQEGQEYYYRLPIQPFGAVTVTEVDDLGLQPLRVTVTMQQPLNGQLGQLGNFVALGDGVFRAEGLTAAVATTQLRALVFTVDTARVPFGGKLATRFLLTVEDGFAPAVGAPNTEVIAHHPFEAVHRPATTPEQGAFGLAGAVWDAFGIVGAPNAGVNGSNSGVAVLYQRVPGPSNTWVQVKSLLPPTVQAGHRFGRSVAMRPDEAAIGAINTTETGAVYLFARDAGGENNWGETHRIAPAGLTTGSRFGYSVALYGDLLAVGAPDEDINGDGTTTGGVFLFGRNVDGPDAWGEIMRWAPESTGSASADTGWSVALSGDTLIVGAPRYNIDGTAAREGAVFVFLRDLGGTDAWGLAQTLSAEAVAQSREYGWDVDLAGDLLAVGAPGMTAGGMVEAGRVMLYERVDSTNAFGLVRELNRSTDSERRFGHSVALEEGRILIGAPHNSTAPNIGAAYVFDRSGVDSTNWTLIEKLMRPGGHPAGLFGTVTSLGSGSGLVGAPADLSLQSNQGFAFFYRFDYNTIPGLIYSLAIDPVFRSHGSGVVTGQTVSVSANVAWTASNTVPWITITDGVSGSSDGTIIYNVAQNPSTEGRSGTIWVSGGGITRTFTMNQAGTSAALTISPTSRNHSDAAVTGQTVHVTGNVDWTASAGQSWITLTEGAAGTGGGTLVYSLAANIVTNSRSSTITVSGGGITRTFTVNQSGAAPAVAVDPVSRQHGAGVTTGQTVSVSANVSWQAQSQQAWVTVTDGATGSGNGSWTYRVDANPTTFARTGTVVVAGAGGASATFTVEQLGADPVLTISPTNRNHGATAASGQNISVTANLAWTAVSNTGWITITAGSSGSGNGSVTYSVAVNSGTERSGTITVSGGAIVRTFTVHQAAAAPTLTLSPTSREHAAAGVVDTTVGVTANVSWTAVANRAWITVTAGASGTGNGMVTYSVTANEMAAERTGAITVSGGGMTRTFAITQTGADPVLLIDPTGKEFNNLAASGETFAVTANLAWTATSSAGWISITGGASGTGAGVVTFSLAQNTGSADRNGTITVAGGGLSREFAIHQTGAALTPDGGIAVDTRRPVFAWPAVAGATWYQVWLNRNGSTYLTPWVQGTTTWTPANDLPAGNYTWWVRGWSSSTGNMPWSPSATFVVPTLQPGPITQIAPQGDRGSWDLVFRWDQTDRRATWYKLWVSHPNGGTWIDQWVQATSADEAEVERFNHPGGASTWWLRGWGPDGFGPWTGPMAFTTPDPAPGKPVLLAPIGATTAPVTFEYTAERAEWYRVYVTRNGSLVIDQWTQNTTFSGGMLPSGSYAWWIGAWNAKTGRTVWSDRGAFTIP